jgi:aspartate aminotransferase-like enzyme
MRVLAGGGPSTPDPRVLAAMTTPLIGQFDPAFTAIMDDVAELGRGAFLTASPHCFGVSATARGGLEAVLNSLLVPGHAVAIAGGAGFVADTSNIAERLGGRALTLAQLDSASLLVAAHFDAESGQKQDAHALAQLAHAHRIPLVLDATSSLGACELRVDDWSIDVCVAGVDHAIGAPSGMSLVTYSPEILQRLQEQTARTSYLDLLQLQAYWSPERLNHHTAPTSLIYGLREALRLVQWEGLAERWQRHVDVGQMLREGLIQVGLQTAGEPPCALIELPLGVDESHAWQCLLERFGIYVTRCGTRRTWRLGLLGADAQPEVARQVVAAMKNVLSSAA